MKVAYTSSHTVDRNRVELYSSEADVLGMNLGLTSDKTAGMSYSGLFSKSSDLRGISSCSGLVPNRETVYLDISDMSEDSLLLVQSLFEDIKSVFLWSSPIGVDLELTYEDGCLLNARSVGVVLPNASLLQFLRKLLGERNDMLATLGVVTVCGTLSLERIDDLDVQAVPSRVVYGLTHLDDGVEYDFMLMHGRFIAFDIAVSSFDLTCEAALAVLSRLGYITPSVNSYELTRDLLQDLQSLGYLSNVLAMNALIYSSGLFINLGEVQLVLVGLSATDGKDWVLQDLEWVCDRGRKIGVLTFRSSAGAYSYDSSVVVLRVSDISLFLSFDLEVGSVISASALSELTELCS